ncbi:hypothetical protein BTGOE6_59550 [Bacillus wiedmannii]|nr:hypothetical protein BTGOE6_59550 [Bacillus wiedmannii]
MKQLQPGQVYELHDVYVGSKDKLPTRIVVYRCTEEQKHKRLRDRAIREKKKGITYTERTKLLQGITVYFMDNSLVFYHVLLLCLKCENSCCVRNRKS